MCWVAGEYSHCSIEDYHMLYLRPDQSWEAVTECTKLSEIASHIRWLEQLEKFGKESVEAVGGLVKVASPSQSLLSLF